MLFLVAMLIAKVNGLFIPWYLWPFVGGYCFVCWILRIVIEFGVEDWEVDE